MTDHTPTPLRVDDKRYNCGTHHEIAVLNANGGEVCRVTNIGGGEDANADLTRADLIVRAVNAYGPMREALAELVECFDIGEAEGSP